MTSAAGPLRLAGVGLKPQHIGEILADRPALGFFEVHAENYMGAGGGPHRHLVAIRTHYPLSIHGVGLSLGGAADLDREHLARLRLVVERYEPMLVSEHLAWSSHRGHFLNDLLPVPYTAAALERVVGHVDHVQTMLGRQILLENPSTYLAFEESAIDEVEFLTAIAKRTGCGLLLDVNNLFVSATNHRRDAEAYLDRFPVELVGEVHLAGHAPRSDADGGALLVDTHDRPVAEPVWALYRRFLALAGSRPTLVERDADIPAWTELLAEARRAEACMIAAEGGQLAVAC